MKKALIIFFALMSIMCDHVVAAKRYVGGDISLLPEYEKAGAIYKTHDGEKIGDLLPFLYQEGMNAMRIRLFVEPAAYTGSDKDANACQDLSYIIPLCKRIVDAGFKLMLDFHYSDTWADPAKQWTPHAWRGLGDDQLCRKINEYTRDVLITLRDNGIVPTFIQTGNEISYGMLWGAVNDPAVSLKKCFNGSEANWPRFVKLLDNAIAACREVCPDAKIVLHTERVADLSTLRNFYEHMGDVDYDIIGLSYYPYFHGELYKLRSALEMLSSKFGTKEIMIVETGYSYKWAVPGTTIDTSSTWAYSDAGQAAFAKDLVTLLQEFDNVTGLFWWWLEYNAYNTSLSGWYNAPLFDSTTGRATSALKEICSFASNSGSVSNIEDDSQLRPGCIYDLGGRKLNEAPVGTPYIENNKVKIKTL